jgi:hypothetical protein
MSITRFNVKRSRIHLLLKLGVTVLLIALVLNYGERLNPFDGKTWGDYDNPPTGYVKGKVWWR